MPTSRRAFGALSLGLLAGLGKARAADVPAWRHGLSLVGALRYGPDFKHTDYVNPQAPKGGVVRLSIDGAFDSFNLILPRGAAPPIAGLVYMPLFEDSLDEVSTSYGAIADAARHPDDFSSATYRIHPKARWHDGQPITPEDVIWSMEQIKKNDPRMGFYYRNVVRVEKTAEREVTFVFDGPGNREKPHIVGQLQVLPRHWWEGTDAQGRKRDISQTSLEPPLGCGPYRVKSFEAGRNVVMERVTDWWAKNLPVYVGQHNFDELRFEVYRDDTVELEGFKADQVDFRTENTARYWATGYDFPAARDGRVKLETFVDRTPAGMQAIILNLRLPKFADVRVRRALNLMFDFESMNANLMFGAYRRSASFFEDTELAARGLPTGQELEILETVRAQVPPELFTTPYANPVNGSQDAQRANLREATRLMREAGYEVRNRRMVEIRSGQPLRIELLMNGSTFERVALAYKTALDRLGIELAPRLIDTAQYINRMNERRFEALVSSYPQTLSPGNEQRDFFGSEAADRPASLNRAGIKNPAIDQLINRIIYAKDRAELVAATKALDRVLLVYCYMIPTWFSPNINTARWNRFGRPERMPEYGGAAFPNIWWWDPQLAQRAGAR
ncbi:MAG: ABC transporter substrate-binding protein [Rhizobiales bacterium]|nr:ABC transporter substrate-binding protein [Hyphomicrobiales bacterium]